MDDGYEIETEDDEIPEHPNCKIEIEDKLPFEDAIAYMIIDQVFYKINKDNLLDYINKFRNMGINLTVAKILLERIKKEKPELYERAKTILVWS